MIIVKPHHLIDIIKLYGAGIECFVPDESFQHDFYKVANSILEDFDTQLQFTIYGDDICKPCNRFKNSQCIDPLDSIKGYDSKDTYNKELDVRLITLLELDINTTYTVRQVVNKMNNYKGIIFNVWLEEGNVLTEKRNSLFQEGLHKIMQKA